MAEKRLMWEGPNGVAERVVLVDLDGNPVAPSGGGGGGGGDASAAHQLTQIARLDTLVAQTDTLEANIVSLSTTQGNGGDSPAASDTATASQIAIAKRHNILLSALAATPGDLVRDSAGTAFSPGSCSHVYGYDGNGNLTTDTATLGAVVRVRTYTYTAGVLTAASRWVVQ